MQQKTLKIIRVGSHSVGTIFPKSLGFVKNERVPYSLKNGYLEINLNELIARKQANFVKHAFDDMTPVNGNTMKKRFPGWGE